MRRPTESSHLWAGVLFAAGVALTIGGAVIDVDPSNVVTSGRCSV